MGLQPRWWELDLTLNGSSTLLGSGLIWNKASGCALLLHLLTAPLWAWGAETAFSNLTERSTAPQCKDLVMRRDKLQRGTRAVFHEYFGWCSYSFSRFVGLVWGSPASSWTSWSLWGHSNLRSSVILLFSVSPCLPVAIWHALCSLCI